MIFFGSAEVYGDYDGVMSEDVMDKMPIKQMNDYAISKWVNELQILNSEAMFGTQTVRMRLFNVYGPGDNFDPENAMVIPTLMSRIHRKEDPVVIWGDGSA